jgi:hypothetical protein
MEASTAKSTMIGAKATFMKVSLKVARNAAKAATATISLGFLIIGADGAGVAVASVDIAPTFFFVLGTVRFCQVFKLVYLLNKLCENLTKPYRPLCQTFIGAIKNDT